jgi:DNA-directed RNA polymerase beta' subunit
MDEIKLYRFGILSNEEILLNSIGEINKNQLKNEIGCIYDPRMGCYNESSICQTCFKNIWECPGHFGHITLNYPVIIYYKKVLEFLKIFCYNCHDFVYNMKATDKYSNILKLSNKLSKCEKCHSVLDVVFEEKNYIFKHRTTDIEISFDEIQNIFQSIKDENLRLLKIDISMFHPKNLVLNYFPVLPISCRPPHFHNETCSDDNLSIILLDIIKYNNNIKKNFSKYYFLLKYKICVYIDNYKIKAKDNNNKVYLGIKERISKKHGLIRQHIMGKRLNQTARTVVGPNPTLKLNQVGIPYEIARSLTIKLYINSINIKSIFQDIKNNPDKYYSLIRNDGNKELITVLLKKYNKFNFLKIGDIIERYLQNGDYVLLNRQPTLHRNSMQCMEVVIHREKTLQLNLSIVSGFNMDFDGDEGNIFILEDIESLAEMKYLCTPSKSLLSWQSPKCEMKIIQDSLLGAYLMTNTIIVIDRNMFQHYVNVLDIPHEMKTVHYIQYIKKRNETIRNKYDIKYILSDNQFLMYDLFTFIFPLDFNYTSKDNESVTIHIERGTLCKGFFDKHSLKDGSKSILYFLSKEYKNDVVASFIDNIQFLTIEFNKMNPTTVSIYDCLPDKNLNKNIQANCIKNFLQAEKYKFSNKEDYIKIALNKTRDTGLKIAKDYLDKNNNFTRIIKSGSKGDFFNITQITGLIGQQNINGGRIKNSLMHNSKSLIHFNPKEKDLYKKYKKNGFISSSFIDGMDPIDFFFHSISGREGVIKTSLGTASSGYIQRIICKINEDIKTHYDGTVRDYNNNILQFYYGRHGFDSSKIYRKKNKTYFINMKRLSDKLNDKNNNDKPYIKYLTREQKEEIIEICSYLPECIEIKKRNVPNVIYENMRYLRRKYLLEQLNDIQLDYRFFEDFKTIIRNTYYESLVIPGESVGIIISQCIGEKQTQSTLNTFHTAGKLQITNIKKIEEIINISNNIKKYIYIINLKNNFEYKEIIEKFIYNENTSIIKIKFKDIFFMYKIYTFSNKKTSLHLIFDSSLLYKLRINIFVIYDKIKCYLNHSYQCFTNDSIILTFKNYIDANDILSNLYNVCIRNGCINTLQYEVVKENEDFLIKIKNKDSDISNSLSFLYCHSFIDNRYIYTNDYWNIYETLGILGVRKTMIEDFLVSLPDINKEHMYLLVEKMTYYGIPKSLNRYTMKSSDTGALSKSSFEESIDVLLSAAFKTETEYNKGVSSMLFSGNRPKIGTNFFKLHVDTDVLKNS